MKYSWVNLWYALQVICQALNLQKWSMPWLIIKHLELDTLEAQDDLLKDKISQSAYTCNNKPVHECKSKLLTLALVRFSVSAINTQTCRDFFSWVLGLVSINTCKFSHEHTYKDHLLTFPFQIGQHVCLSTLHRQSLERHALFDRPYTIVDTEAFHCHLRSTQLYPTFHTSQVLSFTKEIPWLSSLANIALPNYDDGWQCKALFETSLTNVDVAPLIPYSMARQKTQRILQALNI